MTPPLTLCRVRRELERRASDGRPVSIEQEQEAVRALAALERRAAREVEQIVWLLVAFAVAIAAVAGVLLSCVPEGF